MKFINGIFLITMIMFIASCTPKVTTKLDTKSYSQLDKDEEFYILKGTQEIPDGSEYIGSLKIGDSGFSTDCGYETVMKEAERAARNSGANILYLTEIISPNFGSSCYRIKAKLYRNLHPMNIKTINEQLAIDNASQLPDNADYAVIYFYRPQSFYGSAIGYKIRKDDNEIIGRVRNGEKFEYKTSDFGEHEFYGQTESKSSVVINVERGQEYFIRCGIKTGVAVGSPQLTLINNSIGRMEFSEM